MGDLSFGDLTLWQIALVAATALVAQIIGGLTGYGTGLLMPLVLVPLIGAQAIVPVISLSSLLSNFTRVAVFREHLDVRKSLIIAAVALPGVALGAWFYTLLSSRGALFLIGGMLVVLVPLRRYLAHKRLVLGETAMAGAGAVTGLVMGATSGSGVMLLSILMASGLSGQAVIATDAAITLIIGVVKTGVFLKAGVLPPSLWLVAILIGVMATPGALTAKWLARRFSPKIHDRMLEAAIIVGGSVLIWRAVMTG